MIYLYLFGTCFHFIFVFMIIDKYINGISTRNCIDWSDLRNNYDTLASKGKLM